MADKIKTNAARLLEKGGVNYELLTYEVDPNDLSAPHVAEMMGQEPERVFKTLVLQGDKTGYIVCVVPGTAEVDLKKAARVSGNKKVEMIPMKNLLNVTGYIRGGCTPIGMKKKFPTWIHESCLEYEFFFISAGQRGAQLKLNPRELLDFIQASTADLI